MNKITLLSLLILGLFSCQEKGEYYTVQEKTLNEAVYASGEILPTEYERIASISKQRLLKILVKEGDSVKVGEVLAVLGSENESRQLGFINDKIRIAQENAKESEAALSELQSKIELAGMSYSQDSINKLRYNDLAKDGAVSKSKAEEVSLKAEASHTNLKNLQKQYESLKRQLQLNLLNTQQELTAFQSSNENNILSSNIHGIVYSVNVEEGELIDAGEVILLLGSPQEFKLELLVDERDIEKIELGQKVYFETDAFPNEQFEARMSKIVPVLHKVNRSFEAEAKVLESRNFYPQSSVEANILIRENFQALVIPTDFLLKGDSVLLQKGDKKIKLSTGTRNEEWLEVKKGLSNGDVIKKVL